MQWMVSTGCIIFGEGGARRMSVGSRMSEVDMELPLTTRGKLMEFR
jgi:hypothetical protein